MQIDDIVKFWRGEQQVDDRGQWSHRLDRKLLNSEPHSFNLDHPVSPYIGNVLTAPVIILNANAGYNPKLTPTEFPDAAASGAYVARVDNPSNGDWSFVSRYYDDTNYGHWVASGDAVVVNACAYRSPRLSEEDDNKRIIPRLPSSIITRRWLLEAALPMAKQGERLIVVNRGGHWRLPSNFTTSSGVMADPYPRFPRLFRDVIANIEKFLASRP